MSMQQVMLCYILSTSLGLQTPVGWEAQGCHHPRAEAMFNDCNYKGYIFCPSQQTIDLSWLNVRGCQLGECFDLTVWHWKLTRLKLKLYYLNKQRLFGPNTYFCLLFREWWSVYPWLHKKTEVWGHLEVVVEGEVWKRVELLHLRGF